jgi:hypothetical protein
MRYLQLARGMGVWAALICATTIAPFQLGIENTTRKFFNAFTSRDGTSFRVGLISNQTGVTQQGERTVDLLARNGMRIVCLLAPEHGFDGKCPAGKPVADEIDQKSGIPIYSVYGAGGDTTIVGKQINSEIMKKIDILLYDIQDCGMRHYTYISTLLCALVAAAQYNKPLIVFDRPNYLGGNMEGPLVDPDFKSFISIAPIPLRHGMTVGELATYFNTNLLKSPAKLHVIAMKGYTRAMNPPFLAPLSPNVSSLQGLYGYSFLGLMAEIRPFEVGIKTPVAFQCLLLPDSAHFPLYEWSRVKALFKKYGIEATHHTATKNRQQYTGLKLTMPAGATMASFDLLYELIQFFKQAGVPLIFSPMFDKAMGTDLFRKVCNGEGAFDQLQEKVRNDLAQFFKQAQRSFLYKPAPQLHVIY